MSAQKVMDGWSKFSVTRGTPYLSISDILRSRLPSHVFSNAVLVKRTLILFTNFIRYHLAMACNCHSPPSLLLR